MKKGFTVVETLVAIGILVAVITGAMSAVQTGLSSYAFAKNQIIAFYLAQESFEQIRNIRDENSLRSRNWLTNIAASNTDPCYLANPCYVDTLLPNPVPVSCGGTCPLVKQNPINGFYGYTAGWTDTIFRRKIVITRINSHEVRVTVTVDWSKGVISRKFSASELLLDWQ